MKAEKTKFTGFRCPSELLSEIKKAADGEDRSMSNFIVHSLRKAIEKSSDGATNERQHAA